MAASKRAVHMAAATWEMGTLNVGDPSRLGPRSNFLEFTR